MTQYIHGSSQDEQERLEIQHELIGGKAFLPPLTGKMCVLDVGCGTGIVAREISSSVKLGKVIGIDIQEDILTSNLETPDQIKQYAMGGTRLLKASEKELLQKGLLSQEALNQAYNEWENFSVMPRVKATFKLYRVQGVRREK